MKAARWTFSLLLSEGGELSSYKNLMLYTILTRSMKRLMCVQQGMSCRYCSFAEHCDYPQIFGQDQNGDQSGVVITEVRDQRREYSPGETLEFDLVLFGKSIQYFPLVLLAFQEWGRRGLGKDMIPYELNTIREVSIQQIQSEKRLIYDNHQFIEPIGYIIGKSEEDFRIPCHHPPIDRIILTIRQWILLPCEVESMIMIQITDILNAIEQRLTSIHHLFTEVERKRMKSELNEGKQIIHSLQLNLINHKLKKPHKRILERIDKGDHVWQWDGTIEIRGDLMGGIYPILKWAEWLHIGPQAHLGMGRLHIAHSP